MERLRYRIFLCFSRPVPWRNFFILHCIQIENLQGLAMDTKMKRDDETVKKACIVVHHVGSSSLKLRLNIHSN
ncbi:unnamed protein product [Caenorhabditis nigoni]